MKSVKYLARPISPPGEFTISKIENLGTTQTYGSVKPYNEKLLIVTLKISEQWSQLPNSNQQIMTCSKCKCDVAPGEGVILISPRNQYEVQHHPEKGCEMSFPHLDEALALLVIPRKSSQLIPEIIFSSMPKYHYGADRAPETLNLTLNDTLISYLFRERRPDNETFQYLKNLSKFLRDKNLSARYKFCNEDVLPALRQVSGAPFCSECDRYCSYSHTVFYTAPLLTFVCYKCKVFRREVASRYLI